MPWEFAESAWRHLEQSNAIEAWRYWVEQKAPAWWLEAHEWAKFAEKPWTRPGLSNAEKFKLRYRSDPEFRLGQLLRNYRRKAERGRYGEYLRKALKANGSAPKMAALFGYSLADLRAHLERQFTRGMSWERFNRGQIHIDHRRPLASFDLEDPDQIRAAWSLTNLQPLWAERNLSKGARLEFLL